MSTRAIDLVSKTITVQAPVAHAFAVFTGRIADWWPLRTHSVREARTVTLEPFEGGRLYETAEGGGESDWGRVVAWEPPHRVVLMWHAGGPPDTATEVEVRFAAEGAATRVVLEHRGWESRGERAAEVRDSYDEGWNAVLAAYVAVADEGRTGTS